MISVTKSLLVAVLSTGVDSIQMSTTASPMSTGPSTDTVSNTSDDSNDPSLSLRYMPEASAVGTTGCFDWLPWMFQSSVAKPSGLKANWNSCTNVSPQWGKGGKNGNFLVFFDMVDENNKLNKYIVKFFKSRAEMDRLIVRDRLLDNSSGADQTICRPVWYYGGSRANATAKTLSKSDVNELRKEVLQMARRSWFGFGGVKPFAIFPRADSDLFTYVDTKEGDCYINRPKDLFEALELAEKLAAPVAFLASKNVAHQDLKLDNYVLTGESDESLVQLIDMDDSLCLDGTGKTFPIGGSLWNPVGTAGAAAPEVDPDYRFATWYTDADGILKIDAFALGVAIVEAVTPLRPFRYVRGQTRRLPIDNTLSWSWSAFKLQENNFKNFDAFVRDEVHYLLNEGHGDWSKTKAFKEFEDALCGLLKGNPRTRLSAQEFLNKIQPLLARCK